jgi:hypothetical protein
MSKANKLVLGVLAADVANLGTFTVSYPNQDAPESGVTDAGRFFGAVGHTLIVGSNNPFVAPNQIALTFGTSNITVTNRSGATLLAGSPFVLDLKERGDEVYADDGKTKMAAMKSARCVIMNLGAPDAAVANLIRTTGDGVFVANVPSALTGAGVVNGVCVFDVPRNLQVLGTNAGDTTQVLTIQGTDVYGKPLRENITLNGTTTVLGLKAFKTVNRITSSANTVGTPTVGSGNSLGLPAFLPSAGHVLRELANGATAAAGTITAGATPAGGSTATTGDVRGLYRPSVNPDGAVVTELICALPDVGNKGIAQFNG